uniref:Granulins domain-containing protein n=1 Tax=Plectus sambesii TaxID=2011161 RepID=A0A914XCP9_9BILA
MNAQWKVQMLFFFAVTFSIAAICQGGSESKPSADNVKTVINIDKAIFNFGVPQKNDGSVSAEHENRMQLNVGDENIWCDPTHTCPNDMTCCRLTTGEWGCCPFFNAVCCINNKCCPYGTQCEPVIGRCLHWTGSSFPWSNKMKAFKSKPQLLLQALNVQNNPTSFEEE